MYVLNATFMQEPRAGAASVRSCIQGGPEA